MARIPGFTDAERWVVQTTLKERYGKAVAVESGEAELALEAGSDATTPCPALYWQEAGAGFSICKTAEKRYRPMFFYSVHDQYAPDPAEFDDIADCVVTLLKLQEEIEKHRAGPDRDSGPFQTFVDF